MITIPKFESASLIFWPDMMAHWTDQSRRIRERTVYQAGRLLNQLWRDGADLNTLVPELTVFERRAGRLHWIVRPEQIKRRKRVMSHEAVRARLQAWYGTLGCPFSEKEAALFLRAFMGPEGVHREAIEQFARETDRVLNASRAIRPDKEYRRALRDKAEPRSASHRGFWAPDPHLSPALLAAAVRQAERGTGGDASAHKASGHPAMTRVTLLNRSTWMTCHEAPHGLRRLLCCFRPSPGRRAWAAGRTLQLLQIATPRPLGYLEVRRFLITRRSYSFAAVPTDAVTLDTWLAETYHALDEEAQRNARATLRHALLNAHRCGIYHPAPALWAKPAPNHPSTAPLLFWPPSADLRIGVRPHWRSMHKQLAALHAVLPADCVSSAHRLTFLRELAQHHYPTLLEPRSVTTLCEATSWASSSEGAAPQ